MRELFFFFPLRSSYFLLNNRFVLERKKKRFKNYSLVDDRMNANKREKTGEKKTICEKIEHCKKRIE